MKYFLFLGHPNENLKEVTKEKEDRVKEYFNRIEVIEENIIIDGIKYNGMIDYKVFSNLTNFDCFNCVEHCCGDAPTIFSPKIREFILNNKNKFNELTKIFDILEELGHNDEEIEKMVLEEKLIVPSDYQECEIDLCPCAYTPTNGQTLCSLHTISLEKNLSGKEIIRNKPLICNGWPMEFILKDDGKTLYITLPNDFTNSFTIENFYTKSCVNIDFAMSSVFKRENPKGFLEDDYKPFIVNYGETIKEILGINAYNKIKNRLIREKLISESDFSIKKEQIIRKL